MVNEFKVYKIKMLEAVLSYSLKKILKLMFSTTRKILVLGMPQSGKTTLHNVLKNNGKVQANGYKATPNTKDVEECEISYKDEEPITIGKSKDIPGDIDKQLSVLNSKDILNFFGNNNKGLIIYIVNCLNASKESQIEHAARTLRIAFDAYDKAKVAILYSHPDKITKEECKDIHNKFSNKLLENGYLELGEKVKVTNHYLINLIDEKVIEKIIEIFKDAK